MVCIMTQQVSGTPGSAQSSELALCLFLQYSTFLNLLSTHEKETRATTEKENKKKTHSLLVKISDNVAGMLLYDENPEFTKVLVLNDTIFI